MENLLHARNKVGVQDFVLLEKYTDENAFVENLQKRFQEKLIYVCFYFNFSIFILNNLIAYKIVLSNFLK